MRSEKQILKCTTDDKSFDHSLVESWNLINPNFTWISERKKESELIASLVCFCILNFTVESYRNIEGDEDVRNLPLRVCHGVLDLWAKSWVATNWIKMRAKSRNLEASNLSIPGLSCMYVIGKNLRYPGGDFTNFDLLGDWTRFAEREREKSAFWVARF